jgi:GNAT superfamily N-acetyltransferase
MPELPAPAAAPAAALAAATSAPPPPAEPAFRLRSATPADVPALHAMVVELARFERLEHLVTGTPERLAEHLFGPRPVVEAMLAEAQTKGEGGAVAAEPVGFALWCTNFSTFLCRPGLWLEDLYVRPAWRGTGVGRALLERLGALAVERGCGRFEWAVLDWNERAIRFYEQMGAVVMADWRICRVTGPALERFGPAGPGAGISAPPAAPASPG